MAVCTYGAISRTTKTELETEPKTAIPRMTEMEPETEPEAETETDWEPETETETKPSFYVNIRHFVLSTHIRLFVRVIFSVCLSVLFLDVWRFLYLLTHSWDGMTTCQFVLPSSLVLVWPL